MTDWHENNGHRIKENPVAAAYPDSRVESGGGFRIPLWVGAFDLRWIGPLLRHDEGGRTARILSGRDFEGGP